MPSVRRLVVLHDDIKLPRQQQLPAYLRAAQKQIKQELQQVHQSSIVIKKATKKTASHVLWLAVFFVPQLFITAGWRGRAFAFHPSKGSRSRSAKSYPKLGRFHLGQQGRARRFWSYRWPSERR
jgi:hypothetical protein